MTKDEAHKNGMLVKNYVECLDNLAAITSSHSGLIMTTLARVKQVKKAKKLAKEKLLKDLKLKKSQDETKIIDKVKNNKAHADPRRPNKRAFDILENFQKADRADHGKKPKHEPFPNDEVPMRRCYICKWKIIPTQSVMCPGCTKLNNSMRDFTVDLKDRHAIVTGARIKIGFEIALRLLRNGCSVVGTSRFPSDALARFKQVADYDQFKDRLKLCYLDFEDLGSVSSFLSYVEETIPHLDILINNAAQTIYRPPK